MSAWLQRAAATRPDATAIEAPDGHATNTELLAHARAAAGALAARGVASGDRVALALPPGLAFAAALHGCLACGAVAVPVDPDDPQPAIDAVSPAAVVDVPLHHAAATAPEPQAEPDPAAPAAIILTSGTTGAPKPVTLTHGNLLRAARASAATLGQPPDERWLCPLPLQHVGGLMVLVRSAVGGTAAVLTGRFDTDVVGRALTAGEATIVSLVPTMLLRLLDAGVTSPPNLRIALIGGGPIAPALVDRALQSGFPVAATYGLTEACSQVATTPPGDPHGGGVPLDGVRIRIAPDGEILVAGPTVAPGALAADGWLHTGDLGRLDRDGRLHVTGRKNDLIITGGKNVAPLEIERVLEEHPSVAEAAVTGRSDPEWGEAIVALVVAANGSEPDLGDLVSHCRARLARHKVPKQVRIVESLPHTPSGKLARARLGEIAEVAGR